MFSTTRWSRCEPARRLCTSSITNSKQFTTINPLQNSPSPCFPDNSAASKPRPPPVMIWSRVILLPVAFWGVLKVILVRAPPHKCPAVGRLAAPKNSAGDRLEDTSRFPPGVLTMAQGSPLVIVRSPHHLQQGFARTVSSPASPMAEHRVGWPRAASPDLPWSIG